MYAIKIILQVIGQLGLFKLIFSSDLAYLHSLMISVLWLFFSHFFFFFFGTSLALLEIQPTSGREGGNLEKCVQCILSSFYTARSMGKIAVPGITAQNKCSRG